jgi:hypothetical protein
VATVSLAGVVPVHEDDSDEFMDAVLLRVGSVTDAQLNLLAGSVDGASLRVGSIEAVTLTLAS